jgi:para-aminobenzoate synthetase/4-amino-4-deoxychorismate lyase
LGPLLPATTLPTILSAGFSETRARRLALPGRATPASVLGLLGDDRHPVVLSGDWLQPAESAGTPVTILASEPLHLLPGGVDPLHVFDDLPRVGENPDLALAGGGWIGWLGYGLGEHVEGRGVIPPPPPAPLDVPLAWLAFYDHLVVHDGERWWFEMLETAARADALVARFAAWRARLSGPSVLPPLTPGPQLGHVGAGGAGHVAAVAACRERIAAGDLYQANLCFGLSGNWEGEGLALFAQALRRNPPRFGAVAGGVDRADEGHTAPRRPSGVGRDGEHGGGHGGPGRA